ncbi:MAG: gluconate 2-dehydrogenase subunit 3 family protein [Bacteroidota bacterium]
MDRRETLRNLLIGTVAAGTALTTGTACRTNEEGPDLESPSDKGYGIRTPEEDRQDFLVRSFTFFSEGEMAALLVLADAICPEDPSGPAASATKIDEFFEFNLKDMPEIQAPFRGGLAFVQQYSRDQFAGKTLAELEPAELTQLMEALSYPELKEEAPDLAPAIDFMSSMRYMTLTGYYSSREGIKALGYVGNSPNQWDGVPPEVLAKYEVDYEPEWLAKCIDHETANVAAEWDDEGNLLT